jgi:hypothetical protein
MTDPNPPCPTCRSGCSCNPEAGESCTHYGCNGRPPGQDSTCPGAILEISRYAAQQADEHARMRVLRARRAANSHAYALNLARQATAARGDVEATIAEQCPHVEP